ncbi:hypothetical protein IFM89_018951 [Coptis chinensis]|uniref:peptide-methionine (S)-S-oxide reductase n=1 Tax=Coptis chinensis TaxID=261450 RepID=A0A835M2Z5_9MAGN|nr:hypothetical protein IFM89_018951 [Coptis chinensis]
MSIFSLSSSPSLLLLSSSSRFSSLSSSFTIFPFKSSPSPSAFPHSLKSHTHFKAPMSWLAKLGFGNKASEIDSSSSSIPQGPDEDIPLPGHKFAQFGAGCFWGVELVFQRVPGVTKTEVGYTQGLLHNPTYNDVCSGSTKHSEVVRVQYDPKECSFETLLDVFWSKHDPTTLNRQGGDVGTQYRSGIYFYTPEQEQMAKESLEKQQKILNRNIVTEILPAKKFYRAEEYHQQYLAKGGRFGFRQSTEKGCNDPIRCYG